MTLPDLPTVFEKAVEVGGTVAPYAGLFAAGVVVQRFFNLFTFVASLFISKKPKLDEVVGDLKELINDLKGGRMDEVLEGINETVRDMKDLLAKDAAAKAAKSNGG